MSRRSSIWASLGSIYSDYRQMRVAFFFLDGGLKYKLRMPFPHDTKSPKLQSAYFCWLLCWLDPLFQTSQIYWLKTITALLFVWYWQFFFLVFCIKIMNEPSFGLLLLIAFRETLPVLSVSLTVYFMTRLLIISQTSEFCRAGAHSTLEKRAFVVVYSFSNM